MAGRWLLVGQRNVIGTSRNNPDVSKAASWGSRFTTETVCHSRESWVIFKKYQRLLSTLNVGV